MQRSGRRLDPVPGVHAVSTGSAELVRDPDDPAGWTLLVNGVPSSYVDVLDPTRLVFEYVQWMGAVVDCLAPDGDPLRAVHLGGAGCTLARYVAATRPRSRQLVLEVDAALVELARAAFGLTRSSGLRLRVADGRAGLATVPTGTQDLLVRDAFTADVVPGHLTTAEFVAEVRRVLAPGGVYVANVADRPPLALLRSETATALSTFAHVAVLAEPAQLRGRRYGNALLLASRVSLPLVGLARRVAVGVAPARVLDTARARELAGTAAVRRDGTSAPAQPG